MPFKAAELNAKTYHVAVNYFGQTLKIKYNADSKYAEMEEKLDAERVEMDDESGVPEIPYDEVRRKVADLICMVVEEWDYELEDGTILDIDGEAFANRKHPLDFYNRIQSAIMSDFAKRGEGTKKR